MSTTYAQVSMGATGSWLHGEGRAAEKVQLSESSSDPRGSGAFLLPERWADYGEEWTDRRSGSRGDYGELFLDLSPSLHELFDARGEALLLQLELLDLGRGGAVEVLRIAEDLVDVMNP